jgi:predicted MFS family arabinose efflux permease
MTRAIGFTAGPGFGGVLIEVVSAPFAIILDALSFLWSACLVWSIRSPEPRPAERRPGNTLRGDIAEGLSLIFRHPVLRSLAGCSATMNLFNHALYAVLLLYVARDLALSATALGVILAALGIGGFVGAPLAGLATRRLGLGRTIVGAALLPGLGAVLAVVADPTPSGATICLLTISQFVLGLAPTIYNVNTVSLRQAIAPEHLRGRVNASMRFVMWGTMPVGALLGGGLAELIGMRGTLALAALGLLVASSWVVFSPVARLRQTP